MAEIIAEIKDGTISWSLDLEDVHMNIERRLTEKIGDAGKRLHTGRSRNDQVATDIRLWLRDQITVIQNLIRSLQTALVDLAEQNAETVMPGFTHLQVAQPVSFGHHMLAYVEMLGRDFERMTDCRKRVNRMPLGAAALPVRLIRFSAKSPPNCWVSNKSAKTRSMPYPTAILPSSSPPLPR